MTAVGPFEELVDGAARQVDVNGVAVSVVRIGSDVYAIGDVCSHADISLAGGEVWCDQLELECPKHGSAFSLLSGEPSTLPATQAVHVFDASVVDGQVVVTPRTFDTDDTDVADTVVAEPHREGKS
jgi:3-phenylpropionate/trans-cinnamate dioxygenase ferredoxin subunit